MHLLMPLLLSAVLFGIGIYGVLARRNAILILMSVELMLNASNVALIAFDVWLKEEQRFAGTIAWDPLSSGQSLAVFIITIAAAEIGLGLAIVLMIYRQRRTVAIDELTALREPSIAEQRSPASRSELAADPWQ